MEGSRKWNADRLARLFPICMLKESGVTELRVTPGEIINYRKVGRSW